MEFRVGCSCRDLWIESRSLTEKGSGNEPETVGDGELILDHVAVAVARMRVVPLVRGEAGHDKESETDQDVGGHDVEPNLHRQWIHKGKESSRLTGRDLLTAQPTFIMSEIGFWVFCFEFWVGIWVSFEKEFDFLFLLVSK